MYNVLCCFSSRSEIKIYTSILAKAIGTNLDSALTFPGKPK